MTDEPFVPTKTGWYWATWDDHGREQRDLVEVVTWPGVPTLYVWKDEPWPSSYPKELSLSRDWSARIEDPGPKKYEWSGPEFKPIEYDDY